MNLRDTKDRIAVFASGNGSNAENIIRYFRENECGAVVALVVCNNPKAGVLAKARALGVPTVLVNREEFRSGDVPAHELAAHGITHIVLAGFLQMIPPAVLSAYPGRIINIHPSLLPKFGGKGMYGRHVHEAVVAAGERITGITVHHVSEECDGGEIIFQASVDVDPSDTAADVEAKIHNLEREHLPRVIRDTFFTTLSEKLHNNENIEF